MSKRVLFVYHYPLISGAEIVLINIMTHLRDYAVEPVLVCPAGEMSAMMEARGIEVHTATIPVLKKTWNPFILFGFLIRYAEVTTRLLSLLRHRQIDLIYANSFIACLFCGIAARCSGIPLIWHMHDLVRNTAWNRRFISLAGRWSRQVIATTEVMKKNLACLHVHPEKITVVLNGLDTCEFNRQNACGREIREEFGIQEQIPVVGIVGRLSPWKGHRDFFAAARVIADKDPSVHFLVVGDSRIAGDTSYSDELKSLVDSLGLSQNVTFTGFRRDVRDVISAMNVLVSATDGEPFGMTLIEAMALQVPVVAAESGGVVEIISDNQNGRLYPAGRPEWMACAILELLENPALAERLVREALHTVSGKFSLSGQVLQIARLLQAS
jgi:glycosyltransferase involved in cell wall biosynthesis